MRGTVKLSDDGKTVMMKGTLWNHDFPVEAIASWIIFFKWAAARPKANPLPSELIAGLKQVQKTVRQSDGLDR